MKRFSLIVLSFFFLSAGIAQTTRKTTKSTVAGYYYSATKKGFPDNEMKVEKVSDTEIRVTIHIAKNENCAGGISLAGNLTRYGVQYEGEVILLGEANSIKKADVVLNWFNGKAELGLTPGFAVGPGCFISSEPYTKMKRRNNGVLK